MRYALLTFLRLIATILAFAGINIFAVQQRIETNVIYGMFSGTALLMDVHYPADPNGYGIIFIFGKGWHAPQNYDAKQLKEALTSLGLPGSVATALLNAGYTLFSINHRAAPRFRFPAAVEDAQRAVRFVRHNAERFMINPNQLGAFGISSGGHLASMLGVTDEISDDNLEADEIEQESSRVQAVVAYCPATDLAEFGANEKGRIDIISSFIGLPFASQLDTALYREASPISYVSADSAPVLLVHGDADSQVPYKQSETFRDKLVEAGVDTELIRLPGIAHVFPPLDGNIPNYLTATVEWFDQHLEIKN